MQLNIKTYAHASVKAVAVVDVTFISGENLNELLATVRWIRQFFATVISKRMTHDWIVGYGRWWVSV